MIEITRACRLLVLAVMYTALTTATYADDVPTTSTKTVQGLSSDWAQNVDIPAVKDAGGAILLNGAVLKLSVEQGWLIVHREASDGDG